MITIRFVSLLVAVSTVASSFSTIPRPPVTHSVAQVNGETSTYMPTRLLPPLENLPACSTRRLSRIEIQKAIADVKRFVETRLESDLALIRVSYCRTGIDVVVPVSKKHSFCLFLGCAACDSSCIPERYGGQ